MPAKNSLARMVPASPLKKGATDHTIAQIIQTRKTVVSDTQRHYALKFSLFLLLRRRILMRFSFHQTLQDTPKCSLDVSSLFY